MLQEKYTPETLQDMKRVPAAQILHSLPFSSISNIIFVGPEGAGKRTLFSAFLKHTFKNTPSFFSYTSAYEVSPSKTIDVEVLESKEVLEIKLEGMGTYDKKILQKIATDISATKSIKNLMKSYEHAQNQNEDGNTHSGTKVSHPKILFIPDGHLLSTGAQMALRRVLEKGACNFQLVLLTNTLSHLIPAFKSRFLICRVPAPSDQDISGVISHISTEENISIPEKTKQEIINRSNRNMRKAFSLLELAVHKQPLAVAPWDVIIIEIIRSVESTPSVKALVETREKIYKLLNNQVPSTYIFETILEGLLQREKRVEVAKSITEIASKYTARLCAGTKDMFHIEAFIANAMSLYADLE